jgi:hypothetical protein
LISHAFLCGLLFMMQSTFVGKLLATGGDGGEVFLWKPGSGATNAFGADPDAVDPGWKNAGSFRSCHIYILPP